MQSVTHSKFGQGQVISQNDTTVTVLFNGVKKTLVTKFAGLINEDGSDFAAQFLAKEKTGKTRFQKNRAAEKRVYTDSENKRHAEFMKKMEQSELNDLYLPCQVERKTK
jgi:acylphosphatase